jgi:hypothetical protein
MEARHDASGIIMIGFQWWKGCFRTGTILADGVTVVLWNVEDRDLYRLEEGTSRNKSLPLSLGTTLHGTSQVDIITIVGSNARLYPLLEYSFLLSGADQRLHTRNQRACI